MVSSLSQQLVALTSAGSEFDVVIRGSASLLQLGEVVEKLRMDRIPDGVYRVAACAVAPVFVVYFSCLGRCTSQPHIRCRSHAAQLTPSLCEWLTRIGPRTILRPLIAARRVCPEPRVGTPSI